MPESTNFGYSRDSAKQILQDIKVNSKARLKRSNARYATGKALEANCGLILVTPMTVVAMAAATLVITIGTTSASAAEL